MSSFVPFLSDEEILAIGRGLIDRTLPKSAWTHAAHFAAAVWMLSNRPFAEVARELPVFIRAYNEVTGVANTETSGYHETITLASLRGANFFLRTREKRRLFEVCNLVMESPLGKSDWLLTHWSPARLFSIEARRVWVEPDIRALPF